MTETQPAAFKSRWGYHPVDYPTFLKLRRLKKLAWQAVYQLARWKRWNAKTKFKPAKEPALSHFFVQKVEVNDYARGFVEDNGVRVRDEFGRLVLHKKPEASLDWGTVRDILEAFAEARIPRETEELARGVAGAIPDLDLIDRWLAQAEAAAVS